MLTGTLELFASHICLPMLLVVSAVRIGVLIEDKNGVREKAEYVKKTRRFRSYHGQLRAIFTGEINIKLGEEETLIPSVDYNQYTF